jgi:hypothetical protein
MQYSAGDGTVGTFSQIYPGLRWLYENFSSNQENQSPLHFIEYCSDKKKKTVKEYDKSKSQFISISCDCMDQSNLNSKEVCAHSSMIGDTKLISFLGDLILRSASKTEKIENYEKFYTEKFDTKLICSHLDFS